MRSGQNQPPNGYSRNQVHKQEYPQVQHPIIIHPSFTPQRRPCIQETNGSRNKDQWICDQMLQLSIPVKDSRKQYHNSTISKMRSSHHPKKIAALLDTGSNINIHLQWKN
ncbi:hypothetical protein TNCT_723751 [Trichonephila clavata]|uniref:Uncharacterized protein n=1 Tax=Trichonephila clavata TaxID=2740835 RepID=A0A8X6IAZ7_TRICU|nr:hypothetical protein TNCT_723751 [Trichonephila clavata]